MVSVTSPSAIAAIAEYLRSVGYDVQHLANEMHLSDGLHANRDNLDVLLAKTSGPGSLAMLARLLFVCWPVAEDLCRATLPAAFIDNAFACGLLERNGNDFASSVCVAPFRSQLQVCDSTRTRSEMFDMVTGPSATTHFIARLAIGGENETALDLGTGSGALAIEAAAYSRKVIGLDINPRTLQYAEFNALLNGVSNIEWRCGDAFEPVAGERFSRIIANPPFFLSPVKKYTYCDSPLELDGFTAMVAREAPAFLEEDGYFQMLCEWVDLEHAPWEQRLREWTANSGCDVLVLLGSRLNPTDYAEQRANEMRLMQNIGVENAFTARREYLTGHGVEQVIGGLITMRKRSAPSHWFVVFGTGPEGNRVGSDIRAKFDSLTYIASATEHDLLQGKFQMTDSVYLDKRLRQSAEGWTSETVDLVKTRGLVDRLRLDETVSSFLPLFDGSRSLDEIAGITAQSLQLDAAEARGRCLQLVRRLLQSNFVERVS